MAVQISERRKKAYYIGMGLMILGGILFVSTFFTMAFLQDLSESETLSIVFSSAFGGFGLLILGAIIRSIGARGLAGAGVVLDPEKAREELEPYSRMAGGMLKDALEEVKPGLEGKPERVVMIKCPACGKLNEEDSKFCRECGKKF